MLGTLDEMEMEFVAAEQVVLCKVFLQRESIRNPQNGLAKGPERQVIPLPRLTPKHQSILEASHCISPRSFSHASMLAHIHPVSGPAAIHVKSYR